MNGSGLEEKVTGASVDLAELQRQLKNLALLRSMLHGFTYVMMVIYLLSFAFNLLPIIAIIEFKNLHKKATNILVLSLSFADALLGEWF